MMFEAFLNKWGITLCELNPGDIGLSRGHAIQAIEILRIENRVLLGGDVYFKIHESIRLAYANWYIPAKESSESIDEYVARSLTLGVSYITRFPESAEKVPLFRLVPSREPMKD